MVGQRLQPGGEIRCRLAADGAKGNNWFSLRLWGVEYDGWRRGAESSYPRGIETQRYRLLATALNKQQIKPINEHPDRRDFAPAHLCDHFASGRRQDHTDREIAAVWRSDPAGGRSQGARRSAAGALGLDGGRARARHFGVLGGDELRASGARL